MQSGGHSTRRYGDPGSWNRSNLAWADSASPAYRSHRQDIKRVIERMGCPFACQGSDPSAVALPACRPSDLIKATVDFAHAPPRLRPHFAPQPRRWVRLLSAPLPPDNPFWRTPTVPALMQPPRGPIVQRHRRDRAPDSRPAYPRNSVPLSDKPTQVLRFQLVKASSPSALRSPLAEPGRNDRLVSGSSTACHRAAGRR